jgi:hypothetical protein
MSGRIIESMALAGNRKQINRSLETFAPGSYFLLIETERGVQRIPIQIVK